jgi:hypothetical protein
MAEHGLVEIFFSHSKFLFVNPILISDFNSQTNIITLGKVHLLCQGGGGDEDVLKKARILQGPG